MKRSVIYLALGGLALAAAGVGGGYWLAAQRMSSSAQTTLHDHSATQASPGMAATKQSDAVISSSERKVLYWHDPMVPGTRFDKPGKSPFMDMQLVPVYADETGDAASVIISPQTVQNLGIRIAEVKEGRMEKSFSTVGAISIDEHTIFAVQSRVSGYIEKLYVRAQYDAVARGQRLAEIYAPEWLAAQEEFIALKRSAQPGASELAQAARQRLLLLGISERQIQRIEQTGQPDPRVTLFAPENGVVWELGARDGMAVNPGLTLFKLANLGSVWVNAEVPETDAALVRPGAQVKARAAALPGKTFNGKVATLLPDVSAATRTIKARIVLANPGAQLAPGMYATIEFGAAVQSALMVPAEAVIHTGKRTVVIVADGKGGFSPVEVEAGRESGDMTEIRKGLAAGQRVVVSGQFLIDSEASLKSTLGRLGSTDRAPVLPGSASEGKHTGSGKINEIDPGHGTLEISHGPLPSLRWPAMTMEFQVSDKTLLAGVKPGDEVEFEVNGTPVDGNYIITRISKSTVRTAK